MSARKNFLNDASGLITVEFVCTIPLIFAALAFVYEFGRTVWAYEVISQDIRTATRYLSRVEGADLSASDPAGAITLAKTGETSGTAMHWPWTEASCTGTSCVTVTTTSFSSANYNQDGSVIVMTAQVPITLSFLWFIGRPTYTLTVTDDAQYIGD